jgi:LysR family transcriptional regulator, transcriptional activator of the cysJI operon
MLESFRLRVFREVARHCSFRRAAEALYITQPAVTQHIKALEEETGAALFDRGSGGVQLTEAGRTLLRYAEESQRALNDAAEAVAALRGELRGRLQLAASTTIAQYLLPDVLGKFLSKHPAVDLVLESANTAQVVRSVLDGSAALGLIEGPAHRSQLLVTPWLEDELVLVVPHDHEWASRSVRLQELTEARLLLRESGSGTREVLEDALAEAGAPLTRVHCHMELGSTETLLGCIEAGLGVGFASRFAIRRQLRLGSLSVAKVNGLKVRRPLSIVQMRSPELHGVSAAFAESLLSFGRSAKRKPTS